MWCATPRFDALLYARGSAGGGDIHTITITRFAVFATEDVTAPVFLIVIVASSL